MYNHVYFNALFCWSTSKKKKNRLSKKRKAEKEKRYAPLFSWFLDLWFVWCFRFYLFKSLTLCFWSLETEEPPCLYPFTYATVSCNASWLSSMLPWKHVENNNSAKLRHGRWIFNRLRFHSPTVTPVVVVVVVVWIVCCSGPKINKHQQLCWDTPPHQEPPKGKV